MNLQSKTATYKAVNHSFGEQINFYLSRPYFSDVNLLIWVAAFALVKRRRLEVNDGKFIGNFARRWEQLYSAGECLIKPTASGGVAPESSWPNPAGILEVRTAAIELNAAADPIRLPDIDFEGSFFDLCRQTAELFAAPSDQTKIAAREAMKRLGLEPGGYSALHIRRGDKLGGKSTESFPITAYEYGIKRNSEKTETCFVMTDDYSVIGELSALMPSIKFLGLTPETFAGFQYHDFRVLEADEQMTRLAFLLTEVEIAKHSETFIGWFHSNVSNYIALTHSKPERCFDAFRTRNRWRPS